MTASAAQFDPGPAPAHQCINAACGCNDLVSAGACTEWCMANGVEQIDLDRGKAAPKPCGCNHDACRNNGRSGAGTPERGMG